jgi:hypothetical protein
LAQQSSSQFHRSAGSTSPLPQVQQPPPSHRSACPCRLRPVVVRREEPAPREHAPPSEPEPELAPHAAPSVRPQPTSLGQALHLQRRLSLRRSVSPDQSLAQSWLLPVEPMKHFADAADPGFSFSLGDLGDSDWLGSLIAQAPVAPPSFQRQSLELHRRKPKATQPFQRPLRLGFQRQPQPMATRPPWLGSAQAASQVPASLLQQPALQSLAPMPPPMEHQRREKLAQAHSRER